MLSFLFRFLHAFIVFLLRGILWLTGAAVLLFFLLPFGVRVYLESFHDLNVGSVSLTTRDFSIDRIESVNGRFILEELQLEYDMADLIHGRIAKVRAQRLHFEPIEDGPSDEVNLKELINSLMNPVVEVESFEVRRLSYKDERFVYDGRIEGVFLGEASLVVLARGELNDSSMLVDVVWPEIDVKLEHSVGEHVLSAKLSAQIKEEHLDASLKFSENKLGEIADFSGRVGFNLDAEIDFQVTKANYNSGNLKLEDLLSKDLKAFGVDVSGKGKVSYVNQEFKSEGNINLENGFVVYGPNEVRGMSSLIDLARVDVKSGMFEQPLTINLVRSPFAVLTDTRLILRYADQSFSMKSLKSHAWQGNIQVGAVLLYPFTSPQRVLLDVKGVELKDFVQDLKIDRLQATGRVSGRFPVVFYENGEFVVEDATLTSISNGQLSYEWSAGLKSENNEVRLAAEALNDFQYDDLIIHAKKPKDGNLSVKLDLRGKNPKVLDGRPFQINVNISGALLEALETTMNSLRGDIGSFNLKEQTD